ncbi:MAG: flagellar export protein FliJ [Tindallia sp. MSAO_Bac2]|nr:MAG: flagellar export protein FliJ [Tindallia sp. MSAO_Bac2]
MDQNFQFRFDTILSYKEKQEEKSKQLMGEAIAHMESEKEKLESLSSQYLNAINNWNQNIGGQQRIHEIQIQSNQIQWLQDMIEMQKINLEKAEENVEKCRLQLIEAKKETKKFEKIRENDFEQFKAEVKKQEASNIDQFVSHRSATK